MTDLLTYDSKFLKTKLSYYLKEAIKNEDAELELIFGEYEIKNIINKSIFLDLLKKLKEKYNCDEYNSLDIRLEGNKKSSKQLLSNTRCTIEAVCH